MIGTSLAPGVYRVESWKHHYGHDWLLTLTKEAELTNVVPMRKVNRRHDRNTDYNNSAGNWAICIDGEMVGLRTSGKFDFQPTKMLDEHYND